MNSRFRKLAVESLEGRSVLSTVVSADFNGDGNLAQATLTDPHTIPVSLFDPSDNGFDVSAILKTPKNKPITDFSVFDADQDGDMDIGSATPKNGGGWDLHRWLNNGDGTFSSLTTTQWKFPKHGGFF